jgi:hypothetical protein
VSDLARFVLARLAEEESRLAAQPHAEGCPGDVRCSCGLTERRQLESGSAEYTRTNIIRQRNRPDYGAVLLEPACRYSSRSSRSAKRQASTWRAC